MFYKVKCLTNSTESKGFEYITVCIKYVERKICGGL